MKFTVRDGSIKDCELKQIKGAWFYLTPNNGWYVADSNEAGEVLSLGNGCSVVEESTPIVIQPVTVANTVAEIKTYLDLSNIDYLSTDLKADLLARI